nr:protein of unknown function DUF305 [uncultured organism]
MLGASFGVMYIVMYLNTYELDHVYFSLNRFYMTVLMTTTMALLMLAFMPTMYPNKRRNSFIVAGAAAVFAGTLALLRTQTFINDERFMQSMIPHHSIAIMVSERAAIQDPEVRKLADGIINAQKREIAEMKQLLQRLEHEKK